jgi:hypothetical protein
MKDDASSSTARLFNNDEANLILFQNRDHVISVNNTNGSSWKTNVWHALKNISCEKTDPDKIELDHMFASIFCVWNTVLTVRKL